MNYDLPEWAVASELAQGSGLGAMASAVMPALPTVELPSPGKPTITPSTTAQRSGNELRPVTFNDVIGQDVVKDHLRRFINAARWKGKPLSHCLFSGASGTGKTTLAHVCAHELEAVVYQLEAPVSADTLLELREVMNDNDILFLDEIHQQAISERRGKSASTQPEILFSIMEDRTVPTGQGVLPFPAITVMGATTDRGLLPEAFINRFPIKPPLADYSSSELERIARINAEKLDGVLVGNTARIFGGASRGVPREVNNLVRMAVELSDTGAVREPLAREVLEFAGLTTDGLTREMQGMLTFLLTRARHVRSSDGEVTYSASVSTIATAIGMSRDVKAIVLYVEPYLIREGYVQVGHGGRILTDAGIERAQQLLED